MAYGLTQSANLVRASAQKFTAVDSPSVSLSATSFTIETWLNFASTGSLMFLCDKVNAAGGGFRFYFSANSIHLIISSLSNGSDGTDVNVAWTPSTGVWYHVAVTYALTSGNTKFYINGTQQGTTQTSEVNGAFDNTEVFSLCGESAGGARTFDGNVSLYRLWNTELSGATLTTNMCTYFGSAQTNMQAEWSLDNVLTDSSGNSNTLTNVNTATFQSNVPATCVVAVGGRDARELTLLGVG